MASAATEVMAEFNPANTSGSSNSLFSKFARSPSRKHKPRPSSESIDPVSVAAAKASKAKARPGLQRGTTAPDGISTVSSASRGEPISRKISNGSSSLVPPSEKSATMYAVPALSAGELSQDTHYRFVRSDVPKVPPIHGGLAYNPTLAVADSGLSNPNTLYQNIYNHSTKRMATLDYMRKAHEGRMFWFNTIKFSPADVGKLPSYTPNRLSRRATNYLILGMSIPAVLEMHPQPHPSNSGAANAAIAQDYLRSLNALLTEFESYQQLHPPDGSTASSLSRARIPQMFKRASTRPRKSSGVIGSELSQSISAPAMPESGSIHSHQTSFDGANVSFNGQNGPAPGSVEFPATTAFPPPGPSDAANSTLLPNEGAYTYLITPPLPFAPDFYVVFATLCDVLIDVYQRLVQLLSGPDACNPSVNELFTKTDARIRKVMVGGILREFETASRDNAKKELMSVQKVVLGGLMGT